MMLKCPEKNISLVFATVRFCAEFCLQKDQTETGLAKMKRE